jgi:DNA-binding IscR family transcriptional regulator
VRLAKKPDAIRLGSVVAHLEGSGCLVDCERGPCPLADVVARQTGRALRELIVP